jgi:hypothetical protein
MNWLLKPKYPPEFAENLSAYGANSAGDNKNHEKQYFKIHNAGNWFCFVAHQCHWLYF